MPIHSIPYLEHRAAPSPAFPGGRIVRRPVIGLELVNDQNRIACRGLVDSGADNCVFPLSFMKPLGLDPSVVPVGVTTAVGNSSLAMYFANVTIDLGIARFPVYAGFTPGLDQLGFGLLGQAGFFESFKISFDYRKRIFLLETP